MRRSWEGPDIYRRRSSYTSSATRSRSSRRRTGGLRSLDGLSEQSWSTRTELRHCCYKRFVDSLGPPAAAAFDLSHGSIMRHRRPIRPRCSDRVLHVHDADDLRRERDLVAAQAIRIARTVVALVVPTDDRLQVPGEFDRRE